MGRLTGKHGKGAHRRRSGKHHMNRKSKGGAHGTNHRRGKLVKTEYGFKTMLAAQDSES